MNRMKAAALIALGMALGAGGYAVAQAVLPAPSSDPQAHVFATIDLANEFPTLKGYELTLGQTTLATGAGKAPHQHKALPEIVHILSGVLSDQRDGGPPTDHGPGSTLINAAGTTHATLNRGKDPVVFVFANIRPIAH